MRITRQFPFVSEKNVDKGLLQFLSGFFGDLRTAMSGNLTYGDQRESDNIAGQWYTVTNSGPPNVDVTIPHTIAQVPVGFHLMVPPMAGYITNGATPWTASNIYLRCSSPSQAFKIFILAPSTLP